jgi:GntR family transcriptional regulator/MocR family aminotransferase
MHEDGAPANAMELLFELSPRGPASLQQQLREQIAAAILDGHIAPGLPLPSSRKLSEQLGIGRNTVMLAYSALEEDGYLIARERSGYYVNPEVLQGRAETGGKAPAEGLDADRPDWKRALIQRPSEQVNIRKPANWRDFEYCFIYGQLDPAMFPLRHWRECWRDAARVPEIGEWSVDRYDSDDPLLIEQIRTRLLPRRGVWADESQVLVTVGAQHALFLAMRLLLNEERSIGLEDPGYVDARNIAQSQGAKTVPLAVDDQGLVPGEHLATCDCIYVTPSHQSPTTVTLSAERRAQLLQQAAQDDFLLIEDDYEAETSFSNKPQSALKGLDRNDRVIYVGSLSKTLAPGLRIGYLVGPTPFIQEARALRRLMLRHPASNNQRAVALFLGRGYHDSLIRQLVSAYRERWEIMAAALQTHLPQSATAPSFGGSSFWVAGPPDLDAGQLAEAAMAEGILIEPGSLHFLANDAPRHFFRLGYSSVATEKIEPGIRRLADIIHRLA